MGVAHEPARYCRSPISSHARRRVLAGPRRCEAPAGFASHRAINVWDARSPGDGGGGGVLGVAGSASPVEAVPRMCEESVEPGAIRLVVSLRR